MCDTLEPSVVSPLTKGTEVPLKRKIDSPSCKSLKVQMPFHVDFSNDDDY